MIYQNKYCQGECVNLRPCCHPTPPPYQCWCPPSPPCLECSPQRCDDLTMFLIGYIIGQNCTYKRR